MRRVYNTFDYKKRKEIIKRSFTELKTIYVSQTGDLVNEIYIYEETLVIKSNYMVFIYNIKGNFCKYLNKEPMTQRAGKEYTQDIFKNILAYISNEEKNV